MPCMHSSSPQFVLHFEKPVAAKITRPDVTWYLLVGFTEGPCM
jgi:hypothetical protein